MWTKKEYRKHVSFLRKEAADTDVLRWSGQVHERICTHPLFLQKDQILCYLDFRHEVMTDSLIKAAWACGKQVAVPKVTGDRMIFYEIHDFSNLEISAFGIREPSGGREACWEKPLMIMPGVAFDKDRHRIGYGGGFYDRYLAEHPGTVTMAVAFDFQIFDRVPWESTDILPDYLVTPSVIYADF